MEFHSLHKIFHPNVHGEEKQQMLNLNRRLETYLSRVKLLEEENALLASEIQTIRHNSQEDWTHRKCMEEELRQARLEVDAAWRDRVLTELEVGKLTEELQSLELQRQREAQAKVTAKTKLEQSRKELVEEQRAQIWLREKVNKLEHELRFLIQTHEEDVTHLEDALIQSRATIPPIFSQRDNHTPELLKMGNEFYQRATRAWQEASEAYQGQLARLEESFNQTRNRLTQVGQEKLESQLKLQALEKDIASAQDVRLHLETAVAQQRDKHCQEIQQLQGHLEDLKVDKEELGQQIDHIVQENRNLMQLKMSLGLEVATYRALLDRESLRGDVSLLNKPRNISITDAVLNPHVVKQNYKTQLYASHRTTFPSPLRGTGPTAITAAPFSSRKPETSNETPEISTKSADETKYTTLEDPYPKIVQDGAVENFRPQEVCERVTYAEPLSPPNEREAAAETLEDKEEEKWNDTDKGPEESLTDESVVSCQIESGLSNEPCFSGEVSQFTTPSLTSYDHAFTKKPCSFSDDKNEDVVFEGTAEKENVHQLQIQTDTGLETEYVDKMVENVQEEMSDSETEAVLEPTFESIPSSLQSECELVESVFSQVTNCGMDENITNTDAIEIRQELNGSVGETNELEVEDKLYPDGEEMDTWDSVIERKVEIKTDGDIRNEEKKQHAEPEEDISAKELEKAKTQGSQESHVVSTPMLTQADEGQHTALEQEQVPPSDKEDEDDEEDSQNVSVSWRTELESDSYAQDNTLADTRPLIRYKSDETDANTQASHMDESESSEGEHEKKTEEVGTGMWSDGKSKTFGTMEDLCEEVEDESVDEEYNLGYAYVEDRDVSQGAIVREYETQGKDIENADKMVRNSEEELRRLVGCSYFDHDEELEIDRVVEQELENLSTDSYRHISEDVPHLEDKSFEEVDVQEEDGKASCEPGQNENHEHLSFATITDQGSENRLFSELSVVMPPRDTLAVEDVQHKSQDDADEPEKREEEDEHNVPMMIHTDAIESNSGVTDFISRYDIEDSNNLEEPNSVLLITADQKNLQDVAAPPEVTEQKLSIESQMNQVEEAEDFHKIFEASETAEWEVLENPMQDSEIRDQGEDYQKFNIPESADEGALTDQEDPVKSFHNIVPDENNISIVKDATDNSHGLLFPDVKSDSWVSTLESGATYKPDDTCKEAAEQTNQNQGFTDNQVWGNVENQNVVNGNSGIDDSSKAVAAIQEQEQMHTDVKKVLSRNVVGGESIHSEESEAEAESWSSGEDVEQLDCI
ncbi:nestin [Melanotaenia boesemani]|uniref:nestin n=1 Tax=Melanotaenia boesemani TaxID=1250792 RepID=UPI001C0541E1|nr:nestin [Melanotaenia boesemani]